MANPLSKKQTDGAALFPAAIWYFVTGRAVPFVIKNAAALLTFLYFLFILGTSGGVDIRRVTDEQAVFFCAAGFVIWLAGLVLAQMGKKLYQRRRQ